MNSGSEGGVLQIEGENGRDSGKQTTMTFLPCTKEVIGRAEELSGKPVRIVEDPSLAMISRHRLARRQMPTHILWYRNVSGLSPDYSICFECGFIIRTYLNPSDQRFGLAPSHDASKEIRSLLRRFPEASKVWDLIRDTVLMHLYSVPIGLRVDEWLSGNYPQLRSDQVACAQIQLRNNLLAMSPEDRRWLPEKLFKWNTAINAAFAVYWAESLDDSSIVRPFQSLGFVPQGEALIRTFRRVGNAPTEDCRLVDAWAAELGLSEWYQWVSLNSRHW